MCWSVAGGRKQVSLAIFTIYKVSAISYLVWYVEVSYCRSWNNFPLSLGWSFKGFHSEPKFCRHALSTDCQFNAESCTVHPSFIHACRHLFQHKSTPQPHIISTKFPVEGGLLPAGLRAHHVIHDGFFTIDENLSIFCSWNNSECISDYFIVFNLHIMLTEGILEVQ